VPVVDLFAHAPVGNPKTSAYLLAAYTPWFAERTIFLCVVDPGVGGERPAIIVEADGRWYVGNGLFELIQRRAAAARRWDIEVTPEHLSASFHGRDLFAPVAAKLARRRRRSPAQLARRPRRDRLRRSFRQRHDRAARRPRCRARHGSRQRGACWSARGRLATARRAPPSGTRIPTGLPKSPSIKGARTASSVFRSVFPSKSFLELRQRTSQV